MQLVETEEHAGPAVRVVGVLIGLGIRSGQMRVSPSTRKLCVLCYT